MVAALVLLLLVRAGRVAWRQRELTRAIWAAVGWRHLAGALGLLALVVAVATVLLVAVPVTGVGLGTLTGTEGNAVFSPLEEGLARAGPAPASGVDWLLLAGGTVFLGALALLLPWLAFVEEEVFRAGLEGASWARVAAVSLVFGLLHLVMLIPLAAALAIGVAGFVYTLIYRRAAAERRPIPAVARRAYRPTSRARAAVRAAGRPGRQGPDAAVPTALADDGAATDAARAAAAVDAQASGVFHATVWHTTVNTAIVVLVWLSVLATAIA